MIFDSIMGLTRRIDLVSPLDRLWLAWNNEAQRISVPRGRRSANTKGASVRHTEASSTRLGASVDQTEAPDRVRLREILDADSHLRRVSYWNRWAIRAISLMKRPALQLAFDPGGTPWKRFRSDFRNWRPLLSTRGLLEQVFLSRSRSEGASPGLRCS